MDYFVYHEFGYIDFVCIHFGLPNVVMSDNGWLFNSN